MSELRTSARTRGASSSARPRRRTILRRLLITLGVLIVLVGAAAGIAYATLGSHYNRVERVAITDPDLPRPAPSKTPAGSQAPVNILLIGSDKRAGEGAGGAGGTSVDSRGFRSDTIMVAQISPDRKHVTVVSIMRDNWVAIPGHGEAKINAAFSYGGIPLAVNTIEQFIGARIDHLAVVDFASFAGLTDALGGITVTNEIPFTATHGGQRFPAGSITLSGDDALSFVRERYAFVDGDYQRVKNQQAYLKGLIRQVLSRDTLGNPERAAGVFGALQPYLVVDQDLGLNEALALGLDLRKLRSDEVEFFTSPTLGGGTSADGQSIVLPDEQELVKMRRAFHRGTLDAYAAALK